MPYRDPPEESLDLYPGLVVHDDGVTGSITLGRSRLPVWSIIGELINGKGWQGVVENWGDTHGFSREDFAEFLGCLLNMRGEFARLLLMLANAERLEQERYEFDPLNDKCWWETSDLTPPIKEQLRRCLQVLEEE